MIVKEEKNEKAKEEVRHSEEVILKRSTVGLDLLPTDEWDCDQNRFIW